MYAQRQPRRFETLLATLIGVASCSIAFVGCRATVADASKADASKAEETHAAESAESQPGETAGAPKNVTLSDALVQYSLITALAAGDYDQGMPLRKLLANGDFGLGTFDRLDGELILLDGKLYQALADGVIRPADLSGGTPFASVTFFEADGEIEPLSAASLEDLDEQLDRKLPRRNTPYALRIEADLREVTLRSVPAQSPPFQPLVEVVKHQSTWRRENVRGTLIGFRYPKWVGTLNVAGYHWHFLSDDHQFGGHVLNCVFEKASLRYDECDSLVIHIPKTDAFERFDDKKVGEKDIDKIERLRTPGDETSR
jgi:acetolactate decarboxylase